MRPSKISIVFTLALIVVLFIDLSSAYAADEKKPVLSMDSLLEAVKDGHVRDNKVNKTRLSEFKKEKSKQQALLKKLKNEEKEQEALSVQQENLFENNDKSITDLHERLNERLGALKELFGVLQQVSSDAQGQFYNSLTQLQYPERGEHLSVFSEKMGQTTELPSIEEIEQLWFELQREMTETGKVLRRTQAVVTSTGEEVQQEVIRVGAFNIVSNGKYLQFVPETGRVLEYGRQPASKHLVGAEAISTGSNELIPFTIDPTRGQLLGMLGAVPKLHERVGQGGIIGYVIIALGIVAVFLAILRFTILSVTHSKVMNQMKDSKNPSNNPLGRILDEYASHKERDLETLELKMGEAVMREVPKINKGLAFLKIIAAVAPLMGLLGTVTGMIVTFQSIVLYGAGDPKLMAGGISQALVTTVLGLTVAIPTLLMHNLVQTRARSITEVLEQEAVAIVANQAEKQHNLNDNA